MWVIEYEVTWHLRTQCSWFGGHHALPFITSTRTATSSVPRGRLHFRIPEVLKSEQRYTALTGNTGGQSQYHSDAALNLRRWVRRWVAKRKTHVASLPAIRVPPLSLEWFGRFCGRDMLLGGSSATSSSGDPDALQATLRGWKRAEGGFSTRQRRRFRTSRRRSGEIGVKPDSCGSVNPTHGNLQQSEE